MTSIGYWQGRRRARDVTLTLKVLEFEEAKREVLLEALRLCHGHAEGAAYLLGIGNSTMYRLIRYFEVTKDERYYGC